MRPGEKQFTTIPFVVLSASSRRCNSRVNNTLQSYKGIFVRVLKNRVQLEAAVLSFVPCYPCTLLQTTRASKVFIMIKTSKQYYCCTFLTFISIIRSSIYHLEETSIPFKPCKISKGCCSTDTSTFVQTTLP
jgi:hypothetical protein